MFSLSFYFIDVIDICARFYLFSFYVYLLVYIYLFIYLFIII